MAKKIFTDLELHKNEVIEVVIQRVISFPADAREGQMIYHLGLKSFFVCKNDTIDTTQRIAWGIGEVDAETELKHSGDPNKVLVSNSSGGFDLRQDTSPINIELAAGETVIVDTFTNLRSLKLLVSSQVNITGIQKSSTTEYLIDYFYEPRWSLHKVGDKISFAIDIIEGTGNDIVLTIENFETTEVSFEIFYIKI